MRKNGTAVRANGDPANPQERSLRPTRAEGAWASAIRRAPGRPSRLDREAPCRPSVSPRSRVRCLELESSRTRAIPQGRPACTRAPPGPSQAERRSAPSCAPYRADRQAHRLTTAAGGGGVSDHSGKERIVSRGGQGRPGPSDRMATSGCRRSQSYFHQFFVDSPFRD